jgi:hypothetical protein
MSAPLHRILDSPTVPAPVQSAGLGEIAVMTTASSFRYLLRRPGVASKSRVLPDEALTAQEHILSFSVHRKNEERGRWRTKQTKE